ncbi:PRC-barrel domain-containing protein [Pseudomonas sp. KU26590]|uniref:PRC-barrel domain-containing protein n=1 Tax=Pseudomonas sp. KU26590 TaxID=2991051 RepID=UPI00223CDEE4|nr:PRC-barrel domain-containing protein [Pseudomonas sp. KU26590]UZJ57970.1 PRC-barrel domain-containing protein [Pseudomonas sp. KU26590]
MLRSQKDIEKCVIGATDGDVGHVRDLYYDDHAWTIRYLIVDTGSWMAGRNVLISPISLHTPDWPAHRLTAALTKDQVEHSPDIDTDKPVSRQHEVEYFGYYGYADYWGGAGIWGGGMVPMGLYPGYVAVPGGNAAREQAIEDSQRAQRALHRDDDVHLRSCKAVIGYHISATDGEVGHVEGFLIDDDSWVIRYLVINTSNWWMGHKVLLAAHWIGAVDWSEETVAVEMNREAIKTAPVYDPSKYLNRQDEVQLYAHHGRRPYWQDDTAFV